MNEYRVTYTNDSETGTANITERSESAARKDFKYRYKGEGYSIVDIELIHTDVPATKQQERDTLAAIRQMVEELGPNSYVATAFAGCFEIAEWNIENDGADNIIERLDTAVEEANGAKNELSAVKIRLEQVRQESEKRAQECVDLKEQIKVLRESAQNHANAEEQKNSAALKSSLETMRQEIFVLKAKLYDYMTVGA